jgi:hypothetical protein
MSEVRVTQVVAEVIVPFVEGNTTAVGVTTERFDAGEGSEWYIVPAVVDLGDELRAKTLKALRVTGRVTNASAMAYSYDVGDGIVTADLESGDNSSTGAIALTDTTNVTQSVRYPIGVKNAVLSTLRVEGDDTGQSVRDQIHEVIMEAAVDNVRR